MTFHVPNVALEMDKPWSSRMRETAAILGGTNPSFVRKGAQGERRQEFRERFEEMIKVLVLPPVVPSAAWNAQRIEPSGNGSVSSHAGKLSSRFTSLSVALKCRFLNWLLP